jgi:hypothetical protein
MLTYIKMVTLARLGTCSEMGLNESLHGGLILFPCLIRAHGLRDDLRLEICKGVVYSIKTNVLCKLKIKVVVHFMNHSVF